MQVMAVLSTPSKACPISSYFVTRIKVNTNRFIISVTKNINKVQCSCTPRYLKPILQYVETRTIALINLLILTWGIDKENDRSLDERNQIEDIIDLLPQLTLIFYFMINLRDLKELLDVIFSYCTIFHLNSVLGQ